VDSGLERIEKQKETQERQAGFVVARKIPGGGDPFGSDPDNSEALAAVAQG